MKWQKERRLKNEGSWAREYQWLGIDPYVNNILIYKGNFTYVKYNIYSTITFPFQQSNHCVA